MPNSYYTEMCIGASIENVAEEDGLWNDYMPMHDFIQWTYIKCIAKRILTPYQFKVFVLYSRGFSRVEIGLILGVSGQAIGRVLYRAIKNLKKFFNKWFRNRVNIGGHGFFELANREKLLKRGLYNERRC
jgi:hypothetical protein